MTSTELACRRYDQIIRPSPLPNSSFPNLQLSAWLEGDVCTAIGEYWQRPGFRKNASWPIRNLAPEVATEERRLVDQVDANLVACARILKRVAERESIWAEMIRLSPAVSTIVAEEIEFSGTSPPRRTSVRSELVDVLAVERSQVSQIASRFWDDLVCTQDYFHPYGDWMCSRSADDKASYTAFRPFLNPRLHSIGDYVTRCLLTRVDELFESIEHFRRLVVRSLGAAKRPPVGERVELEQAWNALTRSVDDLRARLQFGEEGSLRDSCVILTQVYAALNPSADCDWLGISKEIIKSYRMRYRQDLLKGTKPEIFDRVATALHSLPKIYEGEDPKQTAIEEAITKRRLVLLDGPKIFWEGKEWKVNWRRKQRPWRFLWLLAKRAALRTVVEEADLYPEGTSLSSMGNAANQLRGLLPPELRGLISSSHPPRSYRLELDADQVQVFAKNPQAY